MSEVTTTVDTKATATNTPEFHESVRDAVREHISVNAGVAQLDKAGLDAAFNAAAIDVKEYKRMQAAATHIAAAVIEEMGDKALDEMKAHPEIAQVTGSFKLGHEQYDMTTRRMGSVPVPSAAGEPQQRKEIAGHTTVSRKTTINDSSIKAVRQRIAASAIEKLGK